MLEKITNVRKVLVDALAHFNRADGWAMASHIALSIIMSLFPFLIFATALAGFLGNEARTSDIVGIVFETWPDRVAEPIANEINSVVSKTNVSFLTIGIGAALIFASNGVEAVRVALNRAYRVTEFRSFLFCRLQSLLFVVFGAIVLLVVSIFLVALPLFTESAARAVPVLREYETPFWFLRYGLAITVLAFALFACHAWLPAGKRHVSDIWPGVLVTLAIWLSAAGLFAEYLENFADYGATFGGLASIMTAQIFLYLMAVIVIIGGEFNAAILDAIKSKSKRRPN
jgi:membrane protein